jgi:hypothetical protein
MIPHYQEQSLQGENVAKRRVMKKAKEAFEGEEQRAIKSGQILDEVKASYKTIVQNLQLQLLTMSLTKSTVESIIAAVAAGLPTHVGEDEYIEGDENIAQGNLHSLLIGSLGKLVTLSSQLRILCGNLSDKTRETGRPIVGSADLSKINSLFSDVDISFGANSKTGFNKGLGQMLIELRIIGGAGVPAVERLLELYLRNMSEAHEIIGRLQRNEYETNLEKVFIPSRSTDLVRRADIAAGTEKREFTGEEYKLLVQLRDQGLLRGDDFTSVYSRNRGDNSTISSSELEPDDYSYSSRGSRSSISTTSSRARNVFRPNMYVPRYSRRGYEKEGDSASSVFSDSDDDNSTIASNDGTGSSSGMYPFPYRPRQRDLPDSDDDTLSTGSGLYSIPASYRFPQRIF